MHTLVRQNNVWGMGRHNNNESMNIMMILKYVFSTCIVINVCKLQLR